MRKLTIVLCTMLSLPAYSCPLCNRQIREGIYNSQFYPNLFTMLMAFIVLAIIVIILTAISTSRHRRRLQAHPQIIIPSPVPLTTTAIILGIGIGGFIDGIVLHQILQMHEMLSNKIPATDYIGKSINMFWDGIFHAFCLIVTITGILLLWKMSRRSNIDHSGKLLTAGLLLGWGIFNLVEGIIDHQILQLHNVIEYATDHQTANYIFLGISVIMILVSDIIIRSHRRSHHWPQV